MPSSSLLNSLYEKVVGAIEDAGTEAGDLAAEIVEHFDDAVEAFTDQAQELLDVDAAGVAAVNETLAELVQAVLDAGIDVDARLGELFHTWVGLVDDLPSAAADLLEALFELLSSTPGHILTVLGPLAAALPDFPGIFHALVVRGASAANEYRGYVEAVLLPLLAGALSVPGAGVDLAAKGIEAVMRDDRPSLADQITALEMGLPQNGLPEWTLGQLQQPAVRLRRSSWMMALLMENLRVGSGLAALPGSGIIPNGALNEVFEPVAEWMGGVVNSYLSVLQTLISELVLRILEDADNDFEIEWAILELARFTPVGLFFLVVAIPWKLLTSPLPFLDLLFNPIEEDPDLNVLRLEGPSASRKYVILSDIHRDPESSDLGEFQPGSIDHYMESRQHYLELVRDLAGRGYIIIEAGDCEEMWFHRDFTVRPAQILREIIDSHDALYQLLRGLHEEGRYFRVRGNHDSYLADPDVFEVLRAHMDPDGSHPFEIFDFIVIEGVKTMHDVPFHLGLDSRPNEERKPLIVTHGHQWDFWNCDANNILGKLIVSAVVTPLDMLDDPFKDVGGISSAGSPFINFRSILADLPVFDSWPAYEPAVKLLDGIQHMPDGDRRFSDSILYSETLASFLGLLLAVRPGPDDACGMAHAGGTCLFNLLAIGHTHNPHNEPYYDLEDIPKIGSLIAGVEQAIEGLIGFPTDNLSLVKSSFLNSGVCGWYERCAVGIDLGEVSHCSGQPKLVFWTHNTRLDRPHTMDWELPYRPRGGTIAPGDALDGVLRDWLGLLEEAAGGAVDAAGRAASDAVEGLVTSIPIETALTAAAQGWKAADVRFAKEERFQADAQRAMAQLAIGLLSAMGDGRASRFTIEVPLPKEVLHDLDWAMEQRAASLLPDANPLVSALGLVTLNRELGRRGLRRPTVGGEEDQAGRCLSFLFTLASMSAARGPVDLSMARSGGSIEVTVAIRAPKRGGRVMLRPPTPTVPDKGSRTSKPHDAGQGMSWRRGAARTPGKG